MKILHVVSNIAVGNGIMSVLMNYYNNIDKEQIQFDFLYFDERKITFENEIMKLGGTVYKLPSIKNYFKFRKAYKIFCESIKGKYSIVHIHDCFMIFFLRDIKKRAQIKKIVVHSHNPRLSDNFIGEVRNRLLSIPNKYVPDYFMACSKEAGEYAFGRRFNNGFILNNAIDLDVFKFSEERRMQKRRELNLEHKLVIGNIAGFRKQKNHIFTIAIFEEILKIVPDSVLLLIGIGQNEMEIKNIVKKKNLSDKISFLGTRSDVPDLLCAFDVMLLPSIYEGLGIALIEAQAAGLPCVYSDRIPEVTNIISKNNRILSLNMSAKQWADVILEVINNSERENQKTIERAITQKGYNITNEAYQLQLKYFEMTS